MIKQLDNLEEMRGYFDASGFSRLLKEKGSAIIKINLARPPAAEHPRTDPALLSYIAEYILNSGCTCAIAESADGYLIDNLKSIGLNWLIKDPGIKVIDLDFEDCMELVSNNEKHYIPKCFKDYGIRIGMPAASKRPNATFSNNIKLFVGAVPRRMYQIGEPVNWRPRVHIDLHKSIANIYNCIMDYSPFNLFINGGKIMNENVGEYILDKVFIGDNALELDKYMVDEIFRIDPPEYIKLVENNMK